MIGSCVLGCCKAGGGGCGCRPWGVLGHVDEVLGVGESAWNTPRVVVLPPAEHMDLEEFQAVPHAP